MKSESEIKQLKIVLLSAGLILCVAVLPSLPAYFFVLVRWVVCPAAAYAAVLLSAEDKPLQAHFIPLALLATLFNPLVPVQLPYSLWLVINLGTAVYFSVLTKKL